jgi:2-polyprenyl-3-methyl-5-hydroxy-6-metoxy-1,4-benzoquinol methylase
MTTQLLPKLLDYISQEHPRSKRGVEESIGVSPERFTEIAEMFLGWLVKVRGEEGIARAADAFVQFSTDVNLAQARYEVDGCYQNKSFAEVYAEHYSQDATMDEYLWGIYLTNFLWAHHMNICLLYADMFLAKLPEAAQIVEIAPGHGGWGAWALSRLPQARLQGFDISTSSIQIASSVSRAAGVGDRATYTERNALDLSQMPPSIADGVVCSFLVEHLERPQDLFAVVSHLLKPRAIGFITGALTAAQVDHIYEFRRESELVKMCEDQGLRVLQTLSAGPARTLPKARFLPRSMALIVQKRVGEFL